MRSKHIRANKNAFLLWLPCTIGPFPQLKCCDSKYYAIKFCVPFIKETSFPSSQCMVKSQLVDRLDNWLYCQHKQTEPSVKHFMGCYSILTFQKPSNASSQLLRYHWSPWKSARSPRLRTKSTDQWIIYDRKWLHKDRERNWKPSTFWTQPGFLPIFCLCRKPYYSMSKLKSN